ncbi:MAG: hypothetical protein KDD66_09745 [Bdellovibrionales bacterium]|nr:hypothetical protein [Bdellovibrionales bacterium]
MKAVSVKSRLLWMFLFFALSIGSASAADVDIEALSEPVSIVVKAQCFDQDGNDPGTPNITVAKIWAAPDNPSPTIQAALQSIIQAGAAFPRYYVSEAPTETGNNLYYPSGRNGQGNVPSLSSTLETGLYYLFNTSFLYTFSDFGTGPTSESNPGPASLSEYVCKSNEIFVIDKLTVELPTSTIEALFMSAPGEDVINDILEKAAKKVKPKTERHATDCGYIKSQNAPIPVGHTNVSSDPTRPVYAVTDWLRDEDTLDLLTEKADGLVVLDPERCKNSAIINEETQTPHVVD